MFTSSILSSKGQKILVFTGGSKYMKLGDTENGGKVTEIIDLHSDQFSCNGLPDFPKELFQGIGGLVDGTPMVCGGYIDDPNSAYDDTDNCWVLKNLQWTKIDQKLRNSGVGFGQGSIVVDDKIFVSGGYRKDTIDDWWFETTATDDTYWINENGIFNYYSGMPFQANRHCNVLLNSTHILQTGGRNFKSSNTAYATTSTYFFEFTQNSWIPGKVLQITQVVSYSR